MEERPILEFERQQREELEKLESKRKLIEEMEEKQKSDKAELERMQQEVETQRKETEIVQRQIRKQEESLKRRSFHIENKLKDLLAEKEKFEEERLREQQEIELQKKRQEEESFLRVKEELRRLQELNNSEQAEKIQIFQELDRLQREKDEQHAKLELEKRRLEEQEKEQVLLVTHLEEQLREKQEMVPLLRCSEVQRAEEEKRDLEDIREALLRAREAGAGGEEEDDEHLEKAHLHFLEFKKRQLVKLANLEKDLVQQKDLLRKEVLAEQETLQSLKCENEEQSKWLAKNDASVTSVSHVAGDLEKIKPAEYRLQYKERQLQYLLQTHLPALLEEKQRALEILDRGPLGLDNTLYQVEKEMEEKEEQLEQYRASASQLQQLQATFEFTANVARQEEKVRKKEKEILESQEKQQREALERAVARLERRHSALQRRSTLGLETEEQRQKLASLNSSTDVLEAQQEVLEKDQERLEHEIQQLKQKICEGDSVQRGDHGTLERKAASFSLLPSAEKSHLAPLMDARINAYIEEEVQRRLQDLHHAIGHASNTSADMMKDNEKLHNGTIQRKLKYEENVTNDGEDFQSKSDNFSELMTHKDEHNLGIESSWTLLQQKSQQVSINSRSKQARQSRVLCFVLSESVSHEESTSGSASQSTTAPEFCCEQQDEKELSAEKNSSPSSLITIRTEGNNRLGYFYHKFSALYKDTSSHLLQTGTKMIHQAKHVGTLCDPSGLTSHVTTFIRSLPFLKHLPLDMLLKSRVVPSGSHCFPEAQVGSSSSNKEARSLRPEKSPEPYRASTFTSAALPGSLPSSVFCLDSEDARKSSAFKQTLVQFPDQMLKFQEYSLKDFLEVVTCSLPEPIGDVKDIKGIYWLAVANCIEPDPQPACLLLLQSTLYSLVLSDKHTGSMDIFHVLSLSGLQEIQIGFGGQSIRFLGSTEALLLTVFSYNKNLSQQLCRDLLCVLMSKSEAAAFENHPLLQQDLVQLSLDWKAEIPDLVLANGVHLSSKFQTTLVDMVYFLHGNVGVNILSLAEVQLLLYTTVRVEGKPSNDQCQSLVLLNTHIVLMREDRVFYPHTPSLNTLPLRTQFDVIRCCALSEFRCVVVPEKKNLLTVELVFLQKLRHSSVSGNSPSAPFQEGPGVQSFMNPLHLQGSQHGAPEVWKLTFNSQDEALWLISHLTRL
ncbi:kinesin-like protein KIF16B isoform X7 [Marmota marmota marmota]|uniref:kinesin-like protein KIF16B isoform X7 n=1 Tax=Marmota marmota marmota TaxID=9994 RepID=UPI002092F102|nr:kinesin-like protein KIF16B isoform X7 [Marmota marmota marmota]